MITTNLRSDSQNSKIEALICCQEDGKHIDWFLHSLSLWYNEFRVKFPKFEIQNRKIVTDSREKCYLILFFFGVVDNDFDFQLQKLEPDDIFFVSSNRVLVFYILKIFASPLIRNNVKGKGIFFLVINSFWGYMVSTRDRDIDLSWSPQFCQFGSKGYYTTLVNYKLRLGYVLPSNLSFSS